MFKEYNFCGIEEFDSWFYLIAISRLKSFFFLRVCMFLAFCLHSDRTLETGSGGERVHMVNMTAGQI